MTVTTRKLSFAEYLTYDDGSGNRYELVNGDLVPMGIETGLHGAIAEFLTDQFKAAATQAAPPGQQRIFALAFGLPAVFGGILPAFLMWWFYPLLSGRLCGLEKRSLNLSIHRRC